MYLPLFLATAPAWQSWAAPHWTVPGLFSVLTAKAEFTHGHNWTSCATSIETEVCIASQNILGLCFMDFCLCLGGTY